MSDDLIVGIVGFDYFARRPLTRIRQDGSGRPHRLEADRSPSEPESGFAHGLLAGAAQRDPRDLFPSVEE